MMYLTTVAIRGIQTPATEMINPCRRHRCSVVWGVGEQISKGRGMSNADLNNNPGLLREESYLRKKGLEGLVNILENMLR